MKLKVSYLIFFVSRTLPFKSAAVSDAGERVFCDHTSSVAAAISAALELTPFVDVGPRAGA
jgi:hypothetical protein